MTATFCIFAVLAFCKFSNQVKQISISTRKRFFNSAHELYDMFLIDKIKVRCKISVDDSHILHFNSTHFCKFSNLKKLSSRGKRNFFFNWSNKLFYLLLLWTVKVRCTILVDDILIVHFYSSRFCEFSNQSKLSAKKLFYQV